MTENQNNEYRETYKVAGDARSAMRAKVAHMYVGGPDQERLSIRSIAESFGRSYGFTHRLLTEAVEHGLLEGLRSRGGSQRPQAKDPQK